MNLSEIMLTPAVIMDVVLVMISALAVIYCAMLSRRLRKLNDLKSGLGASIVTLTEAIEGTHKAAVSAQHTTIETVSKLEELILQAEQKAPKFDALIAELENAGAAAKAERTSILQDVETTLGPALEKAQNTAVSLLEVVQHVQRYKDKMAEHANGNIVPLTKAKIQSKADIMNAEEKPVQTTSGSIV